MKIKRNIFFIFILLLVVIASFQNAYAADGTVVSQIVEKFYNDSAKYEHIMLKYAKLLFYWCAILEIAWLGIKMALGTSDLRETLKNFCLVILASGFFSSCN